MTLPTLVKSEKKANISNRQIKNILTNYIFDSDAIFDKCVLRTYHAILDLQDFISRT